MPSSAYVTYGQTYRDFCDVRSIEEIKLHMAGDGVRARDANNLPGSAERSERLNARVLFELDGRKEWRHFRSQAEALKAKANYRGIWSTAWVQYWNHKEMMWN